MILLDTAVATPAVAVIDSTWHIIFELCTILGLTGGGFLAFFNLKTKVDVGETRINSLEKHIEEIKVTATGLDTKLETSMRRLEDKIDDMPEKIAKIFNTLNNNNNKNN